MKSKEKAGAIKFIAKKEKQRRRKKIILGTILFIVVTIIFFRKAPIFNVKTITFEGTSKINANNMIKQIDFVKGSNIFVLNKDKIKETLLEDKYIKEVFVSIKGLSNIKIDIKEEYPVFCIENNKKYTLINENLEKIEDIDDIKDKNLVKILGLDLSYINLKTAVDNADSKKDISPEKLEMKKMYQNILKEFYPYISTNKHDLKIDWINLENFVDIQLGFGDVTVKFGDSSNIHRKMENIYRILLDERGLIKKGYIDVSSNGPPTMKIE